MLGLVGSLRRIVERFCLGEWSGVLILPRSLHCAFRAKNARNAPVGMTGF